MEVLRPVPLYSKKTKRSKVSEKKEFGAFRLQGKNFFLTYPKCPLKKERALLLLTEMFKTMFVCVAHEFHDDGTDHLHALVQMNVKFCTKNSRAFDLMDADDIYHGNYQTAKNTVDVYDYIRKLGDYCEEGIFLSNKQTDVQKRAADNKLIINTPLPQLVASGDISIYSYQQLAQAKNMYLLDTLNVPDYQPRQCVWIYGDTGIGKSRWVRDNYPSLFYNKPQNKWWDGYKGEDVILLDDFDLKGECLGHYLKIWGDCYSFNAEIKGSTIKPSYTKFFITSQYLPKDIFCPGSDSSKWDDELRKAVERRFTLVTVINGALVNLNIN